MLDMSANPMSENERMPLLFSPSILSLPPGAQERIKTLYGLHDEKGHLYGDLVKAGR